MPELFPYQRECLEEITYFEGQCLLSLDMGLGKTPVSLCWIAEHSAWPAVVVCPASVKEHWRQQARQWIGKRVFLGQGQKPDPQPPPEKDWLLVVNWDILQYWATVLCQWGPKMVVFDEIHFAANRERKRTKSATQLARHCEYRLGLSGTPMLNRPVELWKPLNIVLPQLFPSFWKYATRYCNPKRTPWGTDFKGASNTEELHKILTETVMIRRRKQDVLQDLPDKMRSVVPLRMVRPEVYKFATENFLQWLSEQSTERAKRASRAIAVTKLGYLKRLAAKLKLVAARRWIQDFFEADPDGKLVVFGIHPGFLEAVARKIKQPYVMVTGKTPMHQRKESIQRFQQKASIFFGQMQAVGTGVDGLQCAQACAFAELGWRPGDHLQAEDRLHRIGQRDAVVVYYLVATGTVEELLCRVIQQKQAVLSSVLDGGEQAGDWDVFSALLRLMRKREQQDVQ